MHTTRIANIYDVSGPFASVFVDISQDTEDGEHRRDLRVQDALRRLTAQGAPDDVVEQIRSTLAEPVDQPAPVSRLVVATSEGVCFDEVVPERLADEVATWAPLPDLTAWIKTQDSFVPFALVIADREGSDIEIYRSSVLRPSDSTAVHGETLRIHKVPVGGWSQDRYQNVTEEVWKRNAAETAQTINHHVSQGIGLVVLAGDQRARVDIKQAVSAQAAERIVETEAGGRAAGSSREALESAVTEVVHGYAAEHLVEQVHAYQDRVGQQRAVATNLDDVVNAFVRGQVDTLLIDPDQAREVELRPREYPGLALGMDDSAPVSADLVLVAAAARTSAQVVVVPATILDGSAAALLRWDQ